MRWLRDLVASVVVTLAIVTLIAGLLPLPSMGPGSWVNLAWWRASRGLPTPSWEVQYHDLFGSPAYDRGDKPLPDLADFLSRRRGRVAQVLSVAREGGDFSVMCGAVPNGPAGSSCSTPTDATCLPGSALASFSDSSSSKPYAIDWAAMVAAECVFIDGRTDIEINGSGVGATIVRPVVTSQTSVDGGVFRYAHSTTTDSSTARIVLSNLTVENDAFPTPGTGPFIEAAIQIHKENPVVVQNPWQDLSFIRVKLIGNHAAMAVNGTNITTDTDVPRLKVTESELIAGFITFQRGEGFGDFQLGPGNTYRQMSNFADTTDAAVLGTITGILSAASSGVDLVLDGSAPSCTDCLTGRFMRLANAGGCTLAAGGIVEQWILDYDGTTKRATSHDGCTGDTCDGCAYTIPPVPNSAGTGAPITSILPPITDFDWSTMRGGQPGTTNTANTRTAAIVLSSSGTTTVPAGDRTKIIQPVIEQDLNDYGTTNSGTCTAILDGSGGGGIAGIMMVGGGFGDVIIQQYDIRQRVNTEIHKNLGCDPAACILVGGTLNGRFKATGQCNQFNRSDPDLDMAAIAETATGATGTFDFPYLGSTRRNLVPRSTGAATAGTNTTVTLAATETTTVDFYKDFDIRMDSGVCATLERDVIAYSAGRVATIGGDWDCPGNPGAGDLYVVGYTGEHQGSPTYIGESTLAEWSANSKMRVGLIESDSEVTVNSNYYYTGSFEVLPGAARCTQTRISHSDPDDGAATTRFLAVFDESGLTPNATETAVDDFVAPTGLWFTDLRVEVSTAPDNGAGTQTRAVTLRDDGADTMMTCTISETATSCEFTASAVRVASGSRLTWEIVNAATPAAATNMWIRACAAP